jgi:hypothetical protein
LRIRKKASHPIAGGKAFRQSSRKRLSLEAVQQSLGILVAMYLISAIVSTHISKVVHQFFAFVVAESEIFSKSHDFDYLA